MQKAYSKTETISFGIGVVEVSPKTQGLGRALKEVTIAIEHATILHPIQFFNESMETTLIREEIIVQELKKVLGGALDLFHLEYQPIIDSSNGKIAGFEALSRLTSSKLGILTPMEFIGIAEKNQLIIELGQIIFEQAFLFLKKLQGEYGTSLYIAVNVSALQLLEESFVSQLVTMADRIGINLEQLRLEITESLFIDNIPFTVGQLKKIHQLGIKVFLDDFGTGYSSISRLEELNIDSIKFDKYFVDRLIIPNEKGVANDIISMVHHLGKTIVAEGVEKESQKLQLMAMGCDFMQGYLFGKALPPEYILDLLKNEHLAKGNTLFRC
ncbi:EAL domain-containing protein [uncultured Sphaerochaeta sp.]|uniref:EAL domain-containing protein n=1 Tax=uncultured Sphaerochaeta sp. TaxID=886478 RepID=UPI002D1E48DE|nr:EAL domain-containing protein [uncultured Sphaerochaeta sp.]